MGHTKPDDLADLKKEFAEILKLDGITEKKPGVFYLKSMAFLHFHDADSVRWADVKRKDGNWHKIEIDFRAGSVLKKSFVETVKLAHSEFQKKKTNV